MPRPRRIRIIGAMPDVTYFKPVGVPMADLEISFLTVDEFESIRLRDYEDFDQKKAAKKMKISQPTFQRLYESARKKIADAIVNGKAIRIEGGAYKMVQQPMRPRMGSGRGLRQRRGMGGRGRMGGFGRGPGRMCVCPECGYKEAQVRGFPCSTKKCPKCKTRLIRA